MGFVGTSAATRIAAGHARTAALSTATETACNAKDNGEDYEAADDDTNDYGPSREENVSRSEIEWGRGNVQRRFKSLLAVRLGHTPIPRRECVLNPSNCRGDVST